MSADGSFKRIRGGDMDEANAREGRMLGAYAGIALAGGLAVLFARYDRRHR
jgi:hypothetical protein